MARKQISSAGRELREIPEVASPGMGRIVRHLKGRRFQVATGLFLVLAWMVAMAGCSRSGSVEKKGADPVAEARGSNIQQYRYSELHRVPDFRLTEREGTEFGSSDLKGKVWIASFFFSTCKFECSDQNRTLRDEVHEKLAGMDLTILSLTCDPANDTPAVLRQYATEFTTSPKKWKFLTGELGDIQAVGEQGFKVIVDPTTHTKRLLMVDKWGRFRDSFEWKEPEDLRRLKKVARMLMAETEEPSPDEIIKTRALPESVFQLQVAPPHPGPAERNGEKGDTASGSLPANTPPGSKRDPAWPAWRNEEWLTSFELTDAHGKVFRSSEMKGKVWIATFFFTGCTGACPRLLNAVDELRQQLGERPVTFVSISNDPDRDTPRVLKEYSAKFKAGDQWRFLTGQQPLQIRAIGSEFFNVNAGAGETHSEKLTVVDKWGKVRGHFSYDQETEMIRLRLLLDELLGEKQPRAQKSGKN